MSSNKHSFCVGGIECIAVSDGEFSYPAGWLFSNVPQDQIESTLAARNLPPTHVNTPYTCLVIKSGERRLLVDTGADGLAPTTGALLKNLQSGGISASNITDVLLTHGHPDHIGGLLDSRGQLAFPNAQYTMSKTEWDLWTDPSALHDVAMDQHMKQMLVACAHKNLPQLKGRIELLADEREILPGVRVIPAPGHTPGHVALLISSGKDQMLHLADAILHPLLMEHPEWRNIFDLDEQTAVKTRQQLFDRAAADGIPSLAYHFSFPGLGRVRRQGSAFQWEETRAN
jgi:glyoxylase-like metal-dependent hydrolase (beta-lactamase superfamily II)